MPRVGGNVEKRFGSATEKLGGSPSLPAPPGTCLQERETGLSLRLAGGRALGRGGSSLKGQEGMFKKEGGV